MADMVTAISVMVSGAVTWVTTFVETIVGAPMLLFFVVLSVVGLGVGLIRRIIRL